MIGVQILSVPYDSGARGVRMGAGPERILEAGLARRLEARGHEVTIVTVEAEGGPIQAETATAFSLARALSHHVREARAHGRLPLILSGNCFASVGVVSGLDRPVGLLWFDSHGDLNTPETSASGFLDGMALSVLGGRCWQTMAASVPGFAPLSDADLVLLGVRDLDPPEAVHILNTAVRLLEPAIVSQGLAAVLEEMRRRVRSLHVHLDLDVLDPRDGRANHFAAPDGLRLGELVTILSGIAREAAVTSLTLSAYEPAADADGRALHAALESIEAFTDAWADSR
jgi:arginase